VLLLLLLSTIIIIIIIIIFHLLRQLTALHREKAQFFIKDTSTQKYLKQIKHRTTRRKQR